MPTLCCPAVVVPEHFISMEETTYDAGALGQFLLGDTKVASIWRDL